MNYDPNPRMSPGRRQPQPANDDNGDLTTKFSIGTGGRPKSFSASGKRVHSLGRGDNKRFKTDRRFDEQAALKGPATLSADKHAPLSATTQNTFGLVSGIQTVFTIVLVILVAMQTNTVSLSVGDYVGLLVTQNALALITFSMHAKLINRQPSSDADEPQGLSVMRHIRNDRRTMLFFLSAVLSCAATIDIVYIASIAPSTSYPADPFRETGINNYMHRAMDLQQTLVFAIGVVVIMTLLTEVRWAWQSRKYSATMMQVQYDDDDEDEAADERRTPRSIRIG